MDQRFVPLYYEEAHLFNVIGPRFQQQGWVDAYDLFFIIRWKANRAITKIARRIVAVSGKGLNTSARQLSAEVFSAVDSRTRFIALYDRWELLLPIASAILTVFYPNEFTIYDARVCDMLGGFHSIASRAKSDLRWAQYLEFKAAVERATPAGLSLRDKDRYLWSKSRHEGLINFTKRDFRTDKPSS